MCPVKWHEKFKRIVMHNEMILKPTHKRFRSSGCCVLFVMQKL